MAIINTREDLDSVIGTVEYDNFINYLKGSMVKRTNIQVYPENYGKPEYTGELLEPIWETSEDLSIIDQFGFTKEELSNI